MLLKLRSLRPPIVGKTEEIVWLCLNLLAGGMRAEYVGYRVLYDEINLTFFLVYRNVGHWSLTEELTGMRVAHGSTKEEALANGSRRLSNKYRIQGAKIIEKSVLAWPKVMSLPSSAKTKVMHKDSDVAVESETPVPPIRFAFSLKPQKPCLHSSSSAPSRFSSTSSASVAAGSPKLGVRAGGTETRTKLVLASRKQPPTVKTL